MSTLPSYKHTPLECGKKQIRLLRLCAPAECGRLRCTLQIFERDSCPDYEALSYVWGPEEDLAEIEVNGLGFVVRRNLWHFLQIASTTGWTLSQIDRPQPNYLWIDQLCVNQSSDTEKSEQVAAMHRIFSEASRVIAWLGSETAQSNYEITTIHDLAAELLACDGENTVGMDARIERDKAVRAKHDSGQIWQFTILSLQYWTRTWTVQEFLLPKHVIIIWGYSTLDIASMHKVYGSHHYKYCKPNDGGPALEPALLYLQRQGWNLNHARPSDIFWEFGDLNCADPRDKAYGLSALINELTPERPLVVDYSKTPVQVFEDVCKLVELEDTDGPYAPLAIQLETVGKAMQVPDTEIKRCLVNIKEKIWLAVEKDWSEAILPEVGEDPDGVD